MAKIEIRDVLAKLKKVSRSGDQWKACCPAHDDHDPSMSVGVGDSGIVFNCFHGCSGESIAAALGYEIKELFFDFGEEKGKTYRAPFETVTITKLAQKTGLPQEYLEEEIGLVESGREVGVPYWDENDNLVYQKRRVRLEGKEKYLYPKGSNVLPYGLWRLEEAKVSRWASYLFLPEGETDCWTFWRHGLQALGVPGAKSVKCLKAGHVEGIKKLYMIREPGEAGAGYVQRLGKHLRDIGYEGRIYIVKCPDGAKDPNELHKRNPADFVARMREAIEEAREWTDNDVRIRFRRASEIQRTKIQYVWKPRIPLGVVTLIAGKPGLGKSVLSTWLASVVTAGLAFPDKLDSLEVPHSVLLFSQEDDESSIIIPRLEANGANLDRVHIYDLNEYEFKLGDEKSYDVLEKMIVDEKPKVVILDPLVSFVDARVDISKANEVRALLRPIASIMKRHKVAGVVIAHVKKGNVAAAIDAVMGSLDFVAAARSAMIVTRDPENKKSLILSHAKSNGARMGESLRFRLEDVPELEQPRVVWEGVSNMSADELAAYALSPDEIVAVENAERYLKEELSQGARPAKEFLRQSRAYGISKKDIDSASSRLGVRMELINDDWCYCYVDNDNDYSEPDSQYEPSPEQDDRPPY